MKTSSRDEFYRNHNFIAMSRNKHKKSHKRNCEQVKISQRTMNGTVTYGYLNHILIYYV